MRLVAGRKGFTWVEILLVILALVILVIILLPAVARTKGAAVRATCANNLKQWGQIFTLYSRESPGGKYPPFEFESASDLKNAGVAAAPRISSLWPYYLTDPTILVCPADPKNSVARYQNEAGEWALDDRRVRLRAGDSYNYLGWALDKCRDEDPGQKVDELVQMLALAGVSLPDIDLEGVEPPMQLVRALFGVVTEAMKAMSSGESLAAIALRVVDSDLPVGRDNEGNGLGNGGSETVFRLRPDLQRLVVEAGGSARDKAMLPKNVFVMFDKLSADPKQYNHPPGGSNVLFLDGHVEFVKFPGKPPVTKRTAKLLRLIGK